MSRIEEAAARLRAAMPQDPQAGAQMKLQANKFYICDDCWPRAKVFLLQQLGHSEDVVRKAAEEAGVEINDG